MERFEDSLSLCNGEDTRDLLNGRETLRDTTGGGIQRLFPTKHIKWRKNIDTITILFTIVQGLKNSKNFDHFELPKEIF